MSHARSALGACTALSLVAVCGCSLIAPLAGLAGGPDAAGGTPADVGASPDDASGDGASSEASGDDAGGPDADAAAAEGSAGPDASSGGDALAGGETGDAGDSAADAPGESSAPAPIAFVQVAVATPSGTSSSVAASYGKAQAAGDLNVVVVGWNDTMSTVSSVSDTAGNAYTLAVGPTRFPPDLTQSTYYAPNIHAATAGANAVTVAFGQAANVVDVRILEYSGLDPASPLDATAAASGNGAGPAATGGVSTSHARSLLVGAGMSTDLFSGPGASFTARATTSDGDLVEDRIVSATGVYAADAPLHASCIWIMQLAAFH
jgi:hypothetical protein